MEQKTRNNQVIKALSVGLAAFMALSNPVEVQAAQNTSQHEYERMQQVALDRVSVIKDRSQELAAARDTEQKLQQEFDAVRLQLEAEAKSQYARALEDAKYEFDFAQSIVGETKWDYERALYAYETARTEYRQYRKNNWRFWQWHDSEEHQNYADVKLTYDRMKNALESEERKMNEAESAYGRMGSQEVVSRFVDAAVKKAQDSREYRNWQAALNEVVRLSGEQELSEAIV